MTLSSWAKIDLWQSPKSSPQIFTFLSAEQVTMSLESCEMSIDKTGSYFVLQEVERREKVDCEPYDHTKRGKI